MSYYFWLGSEAEKHLVLKPWSWDEFYASVRAHRIGRSLEGRPK